MKLNYRTSVFNDFSIVSKATFYGMKRRASNPKKFDLIDILPVQINPTNLTSWYKSTVKGAGVLREAIRGVGDENVAPPPLCKKNSPTLSVRTFYDIYDEYNVRTCDGVTGLFQDISLDNKDLTSLPRLLSYQSDPSKYVLFRWGSVNFFGQISSIDCSYDAFSCWGQPLKCEATVNIIQIDTANKDNILDCFGSTVKTKIRAHEVALKSLKVGSAGAGVIVSELGVIAPAANRDF